MKLVEIPIRRFQPETPLSRDTYLFLRLNNKNVRIGSAGETISEPMLARILAKGHTHLRIDEASDLDPETFAIHLSSTNGEVLRAETSTPTESPAFTGRSAPDVLPEAAGPPPITFSADVPAPEPESRHRTDQELNEDETRIQPSATEAEVAQKFSTEQEEEDQFQRSFSSEKEPLPAVVRLQSRLAEKKGDNLYADLNADREQALKEAKTVILSSKISEQIISLADQARTAEPGLRDSLRGQIKTLKDSLGRVDAGDLSLEANLEPEAKEEIASIAESLSSASRADQVEKVSNRLATHALARELAQSILAEQESEVAQQFARSATSRDLPATVSRLAAYLGHSLGYTNVDFLSDLACGAIAHFARKEGTNLNEDLLPSLSKRIISSDEPVNEDVIMDGKDILRFLDVYISDKECDRSHKDLTKKIFDRTVEEFSKTADGPSIWSLKKWSSFAGRGPTMDSHSICTRASAKAIKCARNAVK